MMSRKKFQDLLGDIADQAQPIDDLAERVLRKPRRSWRFSGLPVVLAASLAVVGVLALAALPERFTSGGDGGAVEGMPTRQPDSAPAPVAIKPPPVAPPLPSRGVGPVLLTYRMECEPNRTSRDCGRWRVMTKAGRHYQVEDATWLPERNPNGPGVIDVSPDGTKIAYTRSDGSFILRELKSGKTTSLADVPTSVFESSGEESSWSQDGRWLLLEYDQAQLVDLENDTQIDLVGYEPDFGFGVSDGGNVFPLAQDDRDDLALLDKEGRVESRLDVNGPLQGAAGDLELGAISPDGTQFATIAYPENRTARLALFDVASNRLKKQYDLDDDNPDTEAWLDDRRLLVTHSVDTPGADETVAVAVDTRTGERENLLRVDGRVNLTGFATALL